MASVLVPVAAAVVGNSYASALKESEVRLKYTELAISVLREKPSVETSNVRGWAIDVLNRYSGVQIDEKARKELLQNNWFFGGVGATDSVQSSEQLAFSLASQNRQLGILSTVLLSIADKASPHPKDIEAELERLREVVQRKRNVTSQPK